MTTRTRRSTPNRGRWLAAATVGLISTALLAPGPATGSPTGGPATGAPPTGTALAALAAPVPGRFTGLGFDACTAPSNATMNAWLASPYRAIGVYLGGYGGENRGCAQPNLTASWVSTQQAAGWTIFPLYMGLQAPCTTSTKQFRINPAIAATQGRESASHAVTQMAALGLPTESAIFFDMEAYATNDAACRTVVLTFMSAWTARLHDLGYLSGFYSSMNSGVADQVANYWAAGYVRPDYLDFARWDNIVTVTDPGIPASYWSPGRRMKQYRGGHDETWGGVTINIDNDYLDFTPVPATPFGDLTANGWSDVLARHATSGGLHLFPGNGGGTSAAVVAGAGWQIMDAMTRGDANGDGFDDLFGRERTTGILWMYPGLPGGGFGVRSAFGGGWHTVREITAVGDFNRDGFGDVVAADNVTGALYLYTGPGTTFTNRVAINWGWDTVDELSGVGDFDRDGFTDLVARERSTGFLYLYSGNSAGFAARTYLGAGWNTMRDLVGVGDFDRDGFTDLVGVERSTGSLYRYPGAGRSILPIRVLVSGGWNAYQPVL